MSNSPVLIEARSGRKLNNRLTLTYKDGPDEPFATAVQCAADGFGAGMGILFGFKNGSTGKHRVSFTDGSALVVDTRSTDPTLISRGDGTPVASIDRTGVSTATAPDGNVILRIAGDSDEEKNSDLFRGFILGPDDARLGRLDVIRSNAGWGIGVDDVLELLSGDFVGQPGGSLAIPYSGIRLILDEPLTPLQREVLVAVCADIALGVRPYFRAMGEPTHAAWT